MPGPAPKPGRVRRHDVALPWITLPASNDGPVPRLPSRERQGGWHPTTVAWWRRLWRLPMASQWYDNVDTVVRLAYLMDRIYADPEVPAAVHAQSAKLEETLGLTPKARVQLRWRISGEPLLELDRNGGAASGSEDIDEVAETGSGAPVASIEDYRQAMRDV